MSNIAPSFKNLEFDDADSEFAAPFERSNKRRNGIIISVSSKQYEEFHKNINEPQTQPSITEVSSLASVQEE